MSQQQNEEKAKEAKMAVKLLMMLSGTNIIMPEPKREEIINQLGLKESIEFHRCMAELSLVDAKTQENIIKGLMISFLKSTQLIYMGEYAREIPKITMEYCSKHNEYLEKPSPEDFAADLGE